MSARTHLDESVRALQALDPQLDAIAALGARLGTLLLAGGRALICGNGGSAAEAQHLSAELVGRFRGDRRPLSAIALHADTSSMTAIVNDYGPNQVFARQVLAHGRRGDALIALSTSGASENVLEALRAARAAGLWTIALGGAPVSPMAELADDLIPVPDVPSYAVQVAHLAVVHLLAEAVDDLVAVVDAMSLVGRP